MAEKLGNFMIGRHNLFALQKYNFFCLCLTLGYFNSNALDFAPNALSLASNILYFATNAPALALKALAMLLPTYKLLQPYALA